jgi:hypothetical protein
VISLFQSLRTLRRRLMTTRDAVRFPDKERSWFHERRCIGRFRK